MTIWSVRDEAAFVFLQSSTRVQFIARRQRRNWKKQRSGCEARLLMKAAILLSLSPCCRRRRRYSCRQSFVSVNSYRWNSLSFSTMSGRVRRQEGGRQAFFPAWLAGYSNLSARHFVLLKILFCSVSVCMSCRHHLCYIWSWRNIASILDLNISLSLLPCTCQSIDPCVESFLCSKSAGDALFEAKPVKKI